MKHLIGVAAFAAAVVLGVAVTRYFRPAPPPPPPAVRLVEAPPAPPPTAAPPGPAPLAQSPTLVAEIRNIVLERRERSSIASVRLVADARAKPPAKVWVWISFAVPGSRQVFTADPVEVTWPAGGSSLATVEVRTPAPWCGMPGDPGSGYLARVHASAVSPGGAVASGAETGEGVPVLVVDNEKKPH